MAAAFLAALFTPSSATPTVEAEGHEMHLRGGEVKIYFDDGTVVNTRDIATVLTEVTLMKQTVADLQGKLNMYSKGTTAELAQVTNANSKLTDRVKELEVQVDRLKSKCSFDEFEAVSVCCTPVAVVVRSLRMCTCCATWRACTMRARIG